MREEEEAADAKALMELDWSERKGSGYMRLGREWGERWQRAS